MRRWVLNLEDWAIRNYGFESKRTIWTFRFTEILRKIFFIKD